MKKQLEDKTINTIEDRIVRDIRNLFELENEEEDYYKPVRGGIFYSNNYIAYESNGDRKKLSIEEYLNKIRPYFKDILNHFKNSDTWKIQLTISINFMSSRDNDEEPLMHSKSDNIEVMFNDKVDKVIEELFKSLFSRYQIGLKTLMKVSGFIFDCVHLSY